MLSATTRYLVDPVNPVQNQVRQDLQNSIPSVMQDNPNRSRQRKLVPHRFFKTDRAETF